MIPIPRRWPGLAMMVIACLFCTDVWAARISEIKEHGVLEQAARFFTLRDPSLRNALIGSVLMGVSCGLLGSFLIVRKLALMGDALSHAVLPGVALGFLWSLTKNPLAIFVGATAAGLLGAVTVHAVRSTTKHKEDAALGFVLAAFFATGVCLLTMINNLPGAQKSGLDKFMFGQAAALGDGDVILMAIVTGLVVVILTLGYKEFKVTSFDSGFARSIGFPAQAIHYTLMLLLAFSIVVSLQAVGVVLVSAMLITPAAAAYLLTDRLDRMLILAAVFGMVAGAAGSFMSFVGSDMPTGPLMVLAGSAVFATALFFGPHHGIVARWWKQRSRKSRTRRENTLKSVYHVLEKRGFQGDSVSWQELAERRKETEDEARRLGDELCRHQFATRPKDQPDLYLTPAGWQRACEIVRNHRLWELYLTHAAHIAADHVHEDAEKIEHVLGEDTVREIERRLNYATHDPHGRLIPGLADVQSGLPSAVTQGGRAMGFGSDT